MYHTWHKFTNPSTGWKASKTANWTADAFGDTEGLVVTFSECPAGSKAVRACVYQYTTPSSVYYRKYGDTEISTDPNNSGEASHLLLSAADSVILAELWLSTDYKAEFAVTNTATDLAVASPIEYLL